MFFAKSSTMDAAQKNADKFTAHALMAGTAAAAAAAHAAQTAAAAAQVAAHEMGSRAQVAAGGVRQGVCTARGWAAPQLDSAADYWTSAVAPKVSAALRASARQVSPGPLATRGAKRPRALTWALLGAGGLAAAGAAGALVRYRHRAAIAAGTEEDAASPAAADSAEAAASPDHPAAAVPGQSGPDKSGPDKPVNKRVSANGW